MTTWTPKLEKLIKKFASGAEKQTKTYINPRSTVAGTFLKVCFRDSTVVIPAYTAICAELGIALDPKLSRTKGYLANMQTIMEFAQKNGSHVADGLAKVIAADQKISAVADRAAHPFKAAKKVKKAHIAF